MLLPYAMQKGVSDFSYIIGMGLKYGGAGALAVMAVVGTVSIDLVILWSAAKHNDGFLTGYILGSMFYSPVSDPVPLLTASPIISVIAIGLSIILGVPEAGLALFIGWVAAATVFAIGYGLEELSKMMAPAPEDELVYAPAFGMA